MATPSEAHLLAFGRFIHAYAAVESGIKIALSGVLGTELDAALISFAPYRASDLRNVAKSLAKERLKPPEAEQFCCIVGDWFQFNGLRNIIAHSRWTEGLREGAIKPRRLNIREGKADWVGDKPDEQEYTAPELQGRADKLNEVNERLKKFLQTSGLADVIASRID
jgi:hypothetical protein